MKDSFFSKKRYQGLYTPLYRFKEHGDIENYWIQLRYVCNRDDFQTIKTAKGTALNFDMLNDDGEKIFGDIRELSSIGFVVFCGKKNKIVKFTESCHTLWKKAQKYFSNPIYTIRYFDDRPTPSLFKIDTGALLENIDIAQNEQLTFAIYYKYAKTLSFKLNKTERESVLQYRNYDPRIISKTDSVDKLSLYLSLKDKYSPDKLKEPFNAIRKW